MFKIEDERHAEPQEGEYSSFEEAMAELRRRAAIPWDKEPNLCPCTNWKNCSRSYEIVQYDTSTRPWRQLERTEALDIGATGVRWARGAQLA
jgi:hypothetical protein